MFDQPQQPLGRVRGIDRDIDRRRLPDGAGDDRQDDLLFRKHDHPITRPHPGRDQAAGQAPRQCFESGEGQGGDPIR